LALAGFSCWQAGQGKERRSWPSRCPLGTGRQAQGTAAPWPCQTRDRPLVLVGGRSVGGASLRYSPQKSDAV